MKLIITLLVACLIKCSAWGTILTVSNNSAYPAQYTTIQSAITAAIVGDTLYIYPAVYSEAVTLNKRLVLVGAGIDPRRPNRQSTFIYGTLTLTDAAASGSVIMGISVYSTFTCGSPSILVNNLIVSDCWCNGSILLYGNNILLENSILASNYPTGGEVQFPIYNATGNIAQNNYFHGMLRLPSGTNMIIRNNIFASGDANTVAFADLQQGVTFGPSVKIYNNIFYKSDPVGPRACSDACEFKNNIYYLTSDPVPSNPQSSGNINANPLFVSFPTPGAGFSFQYDYRLQAGSPCINYGTDGKDIGMWGGFVPVNAGFEPPIPRIYELSVNNATVPAGGTIQLTIKATKAQ